MKTTRRADARRQRPAVAMFLNLCYTHKIVLKPPKFAGTGVKNVLER